MDIHCRAGEQSAHMRLSSLLYNEDNRNMRKRTDTYVSLVGISFLLVFLSTCSGLTSSNGDAPRQ